MTGHELYTIRTSHGLTQRALAELLGLHANHVAKLERGEVKIKKSLEKLILILLQKKIFQGL